MKIRWSKAGWGVWAARRERGSAMVLVLTLLTLMAVYLLSSNSNYDRLDRELQRLEQQHRERLSAPPAPAVNPGVP